MDKFKIFLTLIILILFLICFFTFKNIFINFIKFNEKNNLEMLNGENETKKEIINETGCFTGKIIAINGNKRIVKSNENEQILKYSDKITVDLSKWAGIYNIGTIIKIYYNQIIVVDNNVYVNVTEYKIIEDNINFEEI